MRKRYESIKNKYLTSKNIGMTLMELLVVLALLSSISLILLTNFTTVATVHKNITKESIAYTNTNTVFDIISQRDSHLSNGKAFANQSSTILKIYTDPAENNGQINSTAVRNFDNYNRKSLDKSDIFWSKLNTSSTYPRILISGNKLYDNPEPGTKVLLGENLPSSRIFTFSVSNDLTPIDYQSGKTNYSGSDLSEYKKWLVYFSSDQQMAHNTTKTLPIVSNAESTYPRVFHFRDITMWDNIWWWIWWWVWHWWHWWGWGHWWFWGGHIGHWWW